MSVAHRSDAAIAGQELCPMQTGPSQTKRELSVCAWVLILSLSFIPPISIFGKLIF